MKEKRLCGDDEAVLQYAKSYFFSAILKARIPY
jgi:hypothetical protein